MSVADRNLQVPCLTLSNQRSYAFYSSDNKSEACVKTLAQVMKLRYTGYLQGQRKVIAYTSKPNLEKQKIFIPDDDREPILCAIDHPDTEELFYIQVERIAQCIAADSIGRGGALIHGALCSLNGCGAIMAGRGEIGKTTASKRLPKPWISYCDDSTLVIPDGKSGFTAHPWPTWSRFYWGGSGGSWSVEAFMPLTTIFFLGQAEEDYLEPIDSVKAKSMIIDTVEHVTRSGRRSDNYKRNFVLQCTRSADAIAKAVPAYKLKVSLSGQFWDKMVEVMPDSSSTSNIVQSKLIKPEATASAEYSQDEQIHLIYRGTSMNPTFFEPEMLTVKPYLDSTPQRGDVVCYHVDFKAECIVHRVFSVKDDIIRTRGDNSRNPDEYTVSKSDILGKVITASKENQVRRIYSGHRGVLDMYMRRNSLKAYKLLKMFLNNGYLFISDRGIARRFKPKHLAFRVVVFNKSFIKYPKLIFNGRTVGSYDYRTRSWKIKRPYRLFIDVKALPHFERPQIKRPPKC